MHSDKAAPFGVRSFFADFCIKCNAERRKGTKKMEKKVTPERKMELARYIREENLGNRLKLRQRESILYGRDTQMPLFEKGQLAETDGLTGYGVPAGEGGVQDGAMSSFKYRMVLAVLLFVGFLLCDTRESTILSYNTDDVYQMITEDSLHLYDGGENAVMEELAELFE